MNRRSYSISLRQAVALLLSLGFTLSGAPVQAHCNGNPTHESKPGHDCTGSGGGEEPADFMIEFLAGGALEGDGQTAGDLIDPSDLRIENGQPFPLMDVTALQELFTCTNRRDDTYGPLIAGVANISTWFISDNVNQGHTSLIARYQTTLLPFDPDDPDQPRFTGTLDIRTFESLGLPLIDLNVGESVTGTVVFVQANGGAKGKDSCRAERNLVGAEQTTIKVTRIAPQQP